MSHTDLKSMTKYGHMYFSGTALTLNIQLNTSCLGMIYSQDFNNIKSVCPANFWKQLSSSQMLDLVNTFFTPAFPRQYKSDVNQESNTWLLNTLRRSGCQTTVKSSQRILSLGPDMISIWNQQSEPGLQLGMFLVYSLISKQPHWQFMWPN